MGLGMIDQQTIAKPKVANEPGESLVIIRKREIEIITRRIPLSKAWFILIFWLVWFRYVYNYSSKESLWNSRRRVNNFLFGLGAMLGGGD